MHRYFASVPRAKGLAWVALLCWKWFRDELALKKVCCCKRRCHRMWKPELWVCKRFSTKNRRRFQVAFSLWLPLTNEEAGSWSFTCGASAGFVNERLRWNTGFWWFLSFSLSRKKIEQHFVSTLGGEARKGGSRAPIGRAVKIFN